MKRKTQGIYAKSSLTGEHYSTYCPHPLPPKDLNYPEFADILEKANVAVGELNSVIQSVPHHSIVQYMYVRKEAVLSSQIEGTQSTLDDLIRYESECSVGLPIDDVEEVSTYVAAMDYGLRREAELPLSLRLIREVHAVLLNCTRGAAKNPGEFRTSQNWIGGTRPGNANFVPVSPDKLWDALDKFEKYMNDETDRTPVLVRCALIHHQFETIHPFLDGNGRVGRLLITLFLVVNNFLKSPLLYISVFFKKHRNLYYEYLNSVRFDGDWEKWVIFFLEAVLETATDAKKTLLDIQRTFAEDDEKINTLKRAAGSAQKVFSEFKKKPLLTAKEITKNTEISKPTVMKSLKHLSDLGIIRSISEKKWGQIFEYSAYMARLNSE